MSGFCTAVLHKHFFYLLQSNNLIKDANHFPNIWRAIQKSLSYWCDCFANATTLWNIFHDIIRKEHLLEKLAGLWPIRRFKELSIFLDGFWKSTCYFLILRNALVPDPSLFSCSFPAVSEQRSSVYPPSVTISPWNLFGKSCEERRGCCSPSCWCVDAEFSQPGISFKTVPGVTITCLEVSMRIFIWTAYFKQNLTLVRLQVMNNSWQHPVISCIKSSSPTRLHCWVSLWLRKRMLNMIFIQNNRERLRGHVCYRLQSTLLSEACYTHGPLMTPHRALLCPATPTICDESQTCSTLSSYEKHHQGRQQWIMGIWAERTGKETTS